VYCKVPLGAEVTYAKTMAVNNFDEPDRGGQVWKKEKSHETEICMGKCRSQFATEVGRVGGV